ncbi:MAG: hypothetical protein HGA98_00185 [Deltaproteobacteria bacterium]|nr:hypothetical protein [Deltaproteobacteria bacterium]
MRRDTLVQPGDVILVHVDGKPSFYARAEELLPDVKRGWLRLRFSVLTLPLQEMIWTLEPTQIDGEPFTMGGTPVRIERLPDPRPAEPEPEPEPEAKPRPKVRKPQGNVIAFRKKT